MDQDTIIADIERRAFNAGVSISTVCKRARVNPTTFSRWKRTERNPEPMGATLHSIARLFNALKAIESEGSRRARKAVRA